MKVMENFHQSRYLFQKNVNAFVDIYFLLPPLMEKWVSYIFCDVQVYDAEILRYRKLTSYIFSYSEFTFPHDNLFFLTITQLIQEPYLEILKVELPVV